MTSIAQWSTEQDSRWTAVLRRDAGLDGTFVYAVRTTGVYCRPSCPARRPKPTNVSFFADAFEAEKSGYRGCKRCVPNGAPPTMERPALVVEACRRIEGADVPPTLADLAAGLGVSTFHFHRIFKAATGLTPKAYGVAHRSRRVRAKLDSPGAGVTAAIYDAGFGSNSRFYETADAMLGMTPTAFKNGGANVAIRFALGQCSLGAILVACSDKGVCAILLGDEPEPLLRDLQDRFPKADLTGGDKCFEALVATVVGFVEQPGHGLDLPLDLQGTAFQQRVWAALRTIPAGDTTSYADLARRIGTPRAVRAVAQACASNPVAVAIPCHRVIRNDGALSGYRWGIERKRALLEKERRA